MHGPCPLSGKFETPISTDRLPSITSSFSVSNIDGSNGESQSRRKKLLLGCEALLVKRKKNLFDCGIISLGASKSEEVEVMQDFDEVGTERVPHRDGVLCAFGFSRSRDPNPVFSRTVISRSRLNHTEKYRFTEPRLFAFKDGYM